MINQAFEEHGNELKLLNHINTDEEERLNYEQMKEAGKGFIKKRRNTPSFSYGDISRNKVSV